MIKWLRRLLRPRWIVVRTRWPYANGWGTYCPRKNMVMHEGHTKAHAQWLCDVLNNPTAEGE